MSDHKEACDLSPSEGLNGGERSACCAIKVRMRHPFVMAG